MAEGYGYKGATSANLIGFGPLKGPDRGDELAKVLAYNRNDDEIVVDTDDTMVLGLTWESLELERVDAGVSVQGVSAGASELRVTITRGEDFTPVQSWVNQLEPGYPKHVAFPWVLDRPPAGKWRYRMVLKTNAGTFTVPAGLATWFVGRIG